eukprot:1309682-Amphidinium_carterae.1
MAPPPHRNTGRCARLGTGPPGIEHLVERPLPANKPNKEPCSTRRCSRIGTARNPGKHRPKFIFGQLNAPIVSRFTPGCARSGSQRHTAASSSMRNTTPQRHVKALDKKTSILAIRMGPIMNREKSNIIG